MESMTSKVWTPTYKIFAYAAVHVTHFSIIPFKDLPVKENGNAKDLDAFTTPSAPPAKLDHKEMLKAEKKKIKSAQKKPKVNLNKPRRIYS